MIKDYNELGHVCPISRRVAIRLGDYMKLDPFTRAYRYYPDARAFGNDPWRQVDNIGPSEKKAGHTNVWLVDSTIPTVTNDDFVVYVRSEDAP